MKLQNASTEIGDESHFIVHRMRASNDLLHEPSDHLSRMETREAIMDAIARLSRNQAVAFVMRAIQEQSYEEIAAGLGCAEATARKHVNRARDRL
ncbi:MAG TPA: sigma-70 family RNA polymerase sigma factor, partial [Pirellulaceae bacterium]|nr:sigma-70 family RNA polymerase sigma factor [Pirellulaceae bacterium]